MNVVSNDCGLKWMWSQMIEVSNERGLKWIWAQMNVVSNECGLKWTGLIWMWSQINRSQMSWSQMNGLKWIGLNCLYTAFGTSPKVALWCCTIVAKLAPTSEIFCVRHWIQGLTKHLENHSQTLTNWNGFCFSLLNMSLAFSTYHYLSYY